MPGQLHYGVTDESRRCYRSVSGALRVCSWANTKLSSLRRQPEASQIGSRDSPLDLGFGFVEWSRWRCLCQESNVFKYANLVADCLPESNCIDANRKGCAGAELSGYYDSPTKATAFWWSKCYLIASCVHLLRGTAIGVGRKKESGRDLDPLLQRSIGLGGTPSRAQRC